MKSSFFQHQTASLVVFDEGGTVQYQYVIPKSINYFFFFNDPNDKQSEHTPLIYTGLKSVQQIYIIFFFNWRGNKTAVPTTSAICMKQYSLGTQKEKVRIDQK